MQTFTQQIEHLLWTGALQGENVLKLYHLLKAYGQGKMSAEALQEAIDRHDPDKIEQWIIDQLPPSFE
jgi:hypothetical protein